MDSFHSSLLFWPISLLAGTLAGFFPLITRSHDQLYTLRTRYCSFFCSFFFCFYSFFFFFVTRNSSNLVQGDRKTKKKRKKNHAYRSSVFTTALVFFVRYLYFICFFTWQTLSRLGHLFQYQCIYENRLYLHLSVLASSTFHFLLFSMFFLLLL